MVWVPGYRGSPHPLPDGMGPRLSWLPRWYRHDNNLTVIGDAHDGINEIEHPLVGLTENLPYLTPPPQGGGGGAHPSNMPTPTTTPQGGGGGAYPSNMPTPTTTPQGEEGGHTHPTSPGGGDPLPSVGGGRGV